MAVLNGSIPTTGKIVIEGIRRFLIRFGIAYEPELGDTIKQI